MVKINGSKERIKKIRHGMIGLHEREKKHVNSRKMLNNLHSASKGHQSKTCTPYEFRGINFETQGTGAPSVRSPLNGKIKHKKYSKLKQKLRITTKVKGTKDQKLKEKIY